jgi:hypothetical protein
MDEQDLIEFGLAVIKGLGTGFSLNLLFIEGGVHVASTRHFSGQEANADLIDAKCQGKGSFSICN